MITRWNMTISKRKMKKNIKVTKKLACFSPILDKFLYPLDARFLPVYSSSIESVRPMASTNSKLSWVDDRDFQYSIYSSGISMLKRHMN